MSNRSNNSAWILVVVLAVCLQVVFVFADCKQTATGTAINFSKAYFLLDADMEAFMCNELIGDEEDSAAFSHIKAMRDEAGDRGFGIGMVQRTITHLETDQIVDVGKDQCGLTIDGDRPYMRRKRADLLHNFARAGIRNMYIGFEVSVTKTAKGRHEHP